MLLYILFDWARIRDSVAQRRRKMHEIKIQPIFSQSHICKVKWQWNWTVSLSGSPAVKLWAWFWTFDLLLALFHRVHFSYLPLVFHSFLMSLLIMVYFHLWTSCMAMKWWLFFCEYTNDFQILVTLPDVWRGFHSGSPTTVQAWRPCPLWEQSPSHPIVLV